MPLLCTVSKPLGPGGFVYLENQVAQNEKPPYHQAGHTALKIEQMYGPLASKNPILCYSILYYTVLHYILWFGLTSTASPKGFQKARSPRKALPRLSEPAATRTFTTSWWPYLDARTSAVSLNLSYGPTDPVNMRIPIWYIVYGIPCTAYRIWYRVYGISHAATWLLAQRLY